MQSKTRIALQCIAVHLYMYTIFTICWSRQLTKVSADEFGRQPQNQAQGRLFQTSETPVVTPVAADLSSLHDVDHAWTQHTQEWL